MKTEEVKSPEKHPAKEIKVQGQVLEKSTNAPVVGASVIIKGTTSGTITDLDGNFVISMPVGATLSVSYINMKTNRDEILESAFQLFMAMNYERVSLQMITKKVGLTKTGIFNYYFSFIR